MSRETAATSGWERFDRYVADLERHLDIQVRLRPKAYVVAETEEEHACPYPANGYSHCSCDCCLEVCGHLQQLRVGTYCIADTVCVVEEYLAIEDQRLHENIVHIAVYECGRRPKLETVILPPLPVPPPRPF